MELNKRKRDKGRERAQSQRYDEFLSKEKKKKKPTNKTKKTHTLRIQYVLRRKIH